jgi:hypothetical protein
MDNEPAQPRGNIPIPDPSLLTTEALDRAIAHLRELLMAKVDARAELVDEKIAAAKEAVSKAETAMSTQLDGLQQNFELEVRALREQINDVKENAAGGAGRAGGKEYALSIAIVVAAALLAFIGPMLAR